MKRFHLKFWPCLLLLMVLIKLPVLGPYVDLFCMWLAKVTASVLHLLDEAVMRNEAIVYRKTYGYSFEVTKQCSGLTMLVVFLSAIIAFPATAINKLKGLVFAIVFNVSLNLFRLMTLLYLKVFLSPAQFDVAHEQLWLLLLALLTVVAFAVWALNTLKNEKFAGLLRPIASIKSSRGTM
jgi:exosortase/archaeosortase family protein